MSSSATASATADLNATTGNNSKGTNVQVVVRCRPLNGEERKSNQPSVALCETETKSVKIAYGPMGKKIQKSFNFDKVFGVYSRQEEVFDSVVRPIVDETLAGFNCTIFAYGQTGTGKTHTMEGDIHSKEDAGIVPRSVNAILEQLEASGAEFTIRVSFLELYNEELQDLLNTSGDKKLKLCEDVKKGVVCQNLEEIAVLNANDIFEILQRGIQQRQTAATLCNKNSSRSHSIFTMKIMIKEYNVEGEEVIRNGQLNLVDLAGSECIGRSGAKNDRAREAGSINQSLLTLGRVITALVDHHPHIPYRDSKLTRLLQESLGGKAKTCIIATFSPAAAAVEETLSTLDYAHRAKNIKNQPTVNQKLTKKVIMKEYFAEIETLRSQLIATRDKNGVYLSPEDFYGMESKIATQEAQLIECEGALKARNEEVKTLRDAHDGLTMDLANTKQELQRVLVALAAAEEAKLVAQSHATDVYRVWQSTESVVGEQKRHENLLVHAGEHLKRQLHHAEKDVQKLLTKVSGLESSEQQRLQKTEAFCSDLDQQHDGLLLRLRDLQSEAQSMQQLSAEQLQQLLVDAQKTQMALSNIVQSQVQTMVANQQSQVQTQQSGMSVLETQLWNEKKALMTGLQQMQVTLDTWMKDCESTLTGNQTQLQEQISTLAELVQDMEGTQRTVQHKTSQFVSAQETLSQEIVSNFEQLVTSLQQEMSSLHEQQAGFRSQQQEMLTQKTAKITSAMQMLFAELISEQTSALNQQAAGFQTSQAEQQSLLKQAKVQVVEQGLQNGMKPLISDFASTLAQEQAIQEKLIQRHVTTVSATAQSLISAQQNMQDMVGQKRKYLSQTLQSVDDMQENSVKRQCQSLNQLKETMTKDQALFAQNMTAMDNTVQQTLTGYFDESLTKQQQSLTASFNQYFGQQAAGFTQQQSATNALQKVTQTHQQQMRQSVSRRSGTTPRKALAVISPVLQRARPAHVIRAEALSQPALTEGSVGYDVVASAIPTLISAVTTADANSVEDTVEYNYVENMVVDEEDHIMTVVTDTKEEQVIVVSEPAVTVASAQEEPAVEEENFTAISNSSKVSSRSSSRSNSNASQQKSASLKIDMDNINMDMPADLENMPPNSSNSTCSSAAATPSNVASKSKLPMTRATRTAKTTSTDLGASGHVSLRSTRSVNNINSDN